MLVFTNGCFDILHRGHVEYLQASKALGTKLVVGLNSDGSVRRLKGLSRPVNTQEDRAAVLLALKCVDEVMVFEEDTPLRLIQQLKPDIITKGGDYSAENVVGFGLAKVIVMPYLKGYSTTRVLNAA
jgi:D-beta-D-heptose 7-phosphate kinase/D-beta-D-heptose 1-phosphate adenosyltransferase